MGIFDSIKALVSEKGNTAPPQQAGPQEANSATVRKKILIVEDDDAIRQLYSEFLTNEGFEVSTAINGQLGLSMVQTNPPQLILLDLMMPVMDGKTMLHQLRLMPQFKTLPVIVLTNAGDVESMRQTKLFDNANEFLIKSNVTPNDILNSIKILLP